MKYLPGPDFPTGGLVVNASEIAEMYETGQGKLRIRGKAEVEKGKNGRVNIVITEIPFTMIGAGIGKFLSSGGNVLLHRLLALFDHLFDDLYLVCIGQFFAAVLLACLPVEESTFDSAQRFCAYGIMVLHCLHDQGIHFVFHILLFCVLNV
jgi:hypothetical protein